MTALSDSLFKPRPAIHANGDRYNFRPAHVSWDRDWFEEFGPKDQVRNIWYTDGHVPHLPPDERKGIVTIGLLLEPPDIHPENYRAAYSAMEKKHLDYLFTHQPHEFETLPQFGPGPGSVHVYPLGGTTIHESDWRIWEKKPAVSGIASEKRGLDGHWLRHEVIFAFQGTKNFDAYGPNYTPVPLNDAGFYRKLWALQGYAYSLAIEPVNTGLVLSEHVLDCFLTGTVPIYWGPPNALRYWGFDELGVMRATRKEGIIRCVEMALSSGMEGYEARRAAIERNFIRAHEFTSTEDWLYRNYPEFFDA